ncbi:MAG: energy-coupling factor transporter ATPase [Oscillospiraceae bacterium]|nr:energy-coupling factor transporter ATPase [Oscillospiraceae bacterium]
MDALTLLNFQDVTFAYAPDAPPVLDGVSLAVARGEFVAVVGHNGSGKSTLAKHCNAVLIPTAGRVTVEGRDTRDETQTLAIRQTVGMVFQNPDNQIVATTVEEDVAFALENLGVPSEEIVRRVGEALEEVGMGEYREYAPHRLSGGQKQRVAIAGVIAMRPRCLVLDEPTAMLDPIGRREVMETVRRLCREHGIAVVLITHHMSEAALAGRVVVMDKGRVIMEGPPRDIFSRSDALTRVGLSVPQTVALAEALKAQGLDLSPGLLDVDECAQAIFRALTAHGDENKKT